MHRALGGAPTLSVLWRSLGRSLRGNVGAGSALLAALRLPPPSRKAESVLTASFQNKKRYKEKSGFVRLPLQH